MLRFDNRVAIITGATHGLGRAYAIMLGARGAKVIVNCRKENEHSRQVVRAVEEVGGQALVVAGDITLSQTVSDIVSTAMDTWGRIDIAISNAAEGGTQSRAFDNVDETIDDVFDLHVRATFRMHQAVWPHMARQKYGRLLATGSGAANGYISLPGGFSVDYPLCKAGLFGLVSQTAAEGRSHGILCNMVMPWAYTKMVAEKVGGSELGRWMEANLKPEQVAAAIAPLVHEDCPVSGEAITAGGGRVGRVFFAATRGVFDPNLTPETALDRWDQIMGGNAADGTLLDVFEQTQPREEAVYGCMLQEGKLPDLSLIAQMPLKDKSKSMKS